MSNRKYKNKMPYVSLTWPLYSRSAPIGWQRSADRLGFPIGSIGWRSRSADRLGFSIGWRSRSAVADPIVDFPTPIGRPRSQKRRRHKNVRTEIPVRTVDREVHSSHGDYFHDHFCVYASGPLSGNFWPNRLDRLKVNRLDRPRLADRL